MYLMGGGRERYARNVQQRALGQLAVPQDEDEGDEPAAPMDEEEEEEPAAEEETTTAAAAAASFEFPEPAPPLAYSPDSKFFRFLGVPRDMPTVAITAFRGMASIKDLTAAQKLVVCVKACMPMPIHASPLLALLVPTEENSKRRVVSWLMSVFHLRSFMLAIINDNGLIPFHASVRDGYVRQCFDEMQAQLRAYDSAHDDRIHQLHRQVRLRAIGDRDALLRFIEYLEAYSFYYVHSLERFLFRCLVEPRPSCAHIRLEHVLTPTNVRPSLDECAEPWDARELLVHFFQLKVMATRRYEESVKADEYEGDVPSARESFDLQQLPHRIVVKRGHPTQYNCPQGTVYRGYVDMLTLVEYFHFCDTERVLDGPPTPELPTEPWTWSH
jgi:hypothetical protein